MTIVEYRLRMEAYQLKQVDRQESLALQAWFNQSVQATTGSKKNPQPKFKLFEQFFDKKAEVDQIRAQYEENYVIAHMSKQELKQSRGMIFAKRAAEFQALKRAGKIVPISERKEKNNG